MRQLLQAFLSLMVAVSACSAQVELPRPSDNSLNRRLPVKRVVLYKNGVGYFEHTGRVRGNQEFSIDFTSAQLNDVLKSLTVLDLGEGRISAVRYNSVAPVAERLRGLRLPLGEGSTRADFLAALRGTAVEVRNGAVTVRGKLLSVERKARRSLRGDDVGEVTEISVVTDSGELRTFELGPSTSVRIADRELGQEVGRYLSVVGSSRAQDLRRLTVSAAGSGDREIFVSYISEVPVWKSTYRILLSSKAESKALLQGWAIVDNTVGEDWKDVQLSLVAGSPQSFVQEISQPFYVRRPVLELPQSVLLTPQTHQATLITAPPPGEPSALGSAQLQGTVKDPAGAAISNARVTLRNEITGATQVATTNDLGFYVFPNVPGGNSVVFVEAAGFQRYVLSNLYLGIGRTNEVNTTLSVGAMETVEVVSSAPSVESTTSMLSTRRSLSPQEAAERLESEATARSAGDLFRYEIRQRISIGKSQSALIPIAQENLEAEKVTLVNGENDAKPLRALWIKNTSGLTLDSGTFHVVDGETFAGEGVIETLRPNERRLVSYAADSAVGVVSDETDNEQPVTRVRIAKGVMKATRQERKTTTYTIHNSDPATRQVIVEHPASGAWKLVGLAKPEESSASFHRFRLPVESGKTARLEVPQVREDETTYELGDLDSETVELFVRQRKRSPALEQALSQVLAKRNEISMLDAQVRTREQEIASINADQGRLRENMKALKGSSEERALIQRYARQLDSQEDRLGLLRSEIANLKGQQDNKRRELDGILQEIVLDESF